ncbi:MAG: hypothetical protein U0599_06255 [Vicinamibacteria bacterium]
MQVVARQDVPWDPERHDGAVRLLLSCGSDRAVRRLLHATPADDPAPRPELVELLDIVCPDPLTAVGEALKTEERRSSRAVARQLIEHYGRRREQEIRRRFDESRGRVAADYLRSLGNLEKAAALSFVARQTAHPDEEVREEALWHVERAAFRPLGYALVEAVRRTGGPHRGRAARPRRAIGRPPVRPAAARDSPRRGRWPRRGSPRRERRGAARARRGPRPVAGDPHAQGRFFRRRLGGTIREQVVAAAAAVQAPGGDGARLVDLARSAARGEAERGWRVCWPPRRRESGDEQRRGPRAHLHLALRRPRSGEPDVARQLREEGHRLVFLLNGLVRGSRLYDLDNAALAGPAEELAAVLSGHLDRIGAVAVSAVESEIYVNDVRLRVRPAQHVAIEQLAAELARHEAGGLVFHHALRADALRRVAHALAAPATSPRLESLRAQVAEGRRRGSDGSPPPPHRPGGRRAARRRDAHPRGGWPPPRGARGRGRRPGGCRARCR